MFLFSSLFFLLAFSIYSIIFSVAWWKKLNKKLPNWTIYRLRQDSQLLQSRAINWSQDFQTQNHLNGSTISISSSTGNINNECTESTSSTETLKWLGSMSDVSVVSQATNTSTLSGKYYISLNCFPGARRRRRAIHKTMANQTPFVIN